MKKFVLISLLVGMLASCSNLFDYSPYTLDFSEDERDLNRKNAELLQSKQSTFLYSDTITVAFTGDTHRFYREWEEFVEKVNQIANVDFVIHVGDFTDFGLPRQYQWGSRIMNQLNVPYLVAVGNHDLVGIGQQAFLEMFGPLGFSVIVGRTKLIILNNNSREFAYSGEVPDIDWLENELSHNETFDNALLIFHVPLNDSDFDANMRDDFIRILNSSPSIIAAVHGHIHNFEAYMLDDCSVPMINVWGVEHKALTVLKINKSGYEIENHSF